MKFNKENIMNAVKECVQKLNNLDDNQMQKLVVMLRIDDYSQYEEILDHIFYNYPTEYVTDKIYNEESDNPKPYAIITRMEVTIDDRVVIISLGTIPVEHYEYYTGTIVEGAALIDTIYNGQKNNTMILTLYSQFEYKFSKEE